jgi:hypothetical protein
MLSVLVDRVLCDRFGLERMLREDELLDLVIVLDLDGDVRVIGEDRDGVVILLVPRDDVEGRVICVDRLVLRLVIRRVSELLPDRIGEELDLVDRELDRLRNELDLFDIDGVLDLVIDRVVLIDELRWRLPIDKPPR